MLLGGNSFLKKGYPLRFTPDGSFPSGIQDAFLEACDIAVSRGLLSREAAQLLRETSYEQFYHFEQYTLGERSDVKTDSPKSKSSLHS